MNMNTFKVLIIEDDNKECQKFIDCIKNRIDFEIVGITDSDTEGLNLLKQTKPNGIILDIELNNSSSGNPNSLEFLSNLKNLNLGYSPIIIVTTHINSKRTYEIIHRNGADLILYKGHPKYSCNYVLNQFLSLYNTSSKSELELSNERTRENKNKLSNLIDHELNLIGVTSNLKGRQYIHDAIIYLIENRNSNNISVIQYLTKVHKKSGTTITNGIQNAIIHAWRVSSIEDLSTYYTAKVNYETGLPTPMEFIYYYVDKISNML